MEKREAHGECSVRLEPVSSEDANASSAGNGTVAVRMHVRMRNVAKFVHGIGWDTARTAEKCGSEFGAMTRAKARRRRLVPSLP